MKHCLDCDKEIPEDAEYCPNCEHDDYSESGWPAVRISAASLVFGILGVVILVALIIALANSLGSGWELFVVLLGICDVISVSCGVAAISITRKTRERGLWMAITGITLSVLSLIGVGITFLIGFSIAMSL